MAKFEVKTGLGYFKNSQGNVVSYARLNTGEHECTEGFTYYEVETEEDLEKVELYKEPMKSEEISEKKIQEKLREIAVTEIKKEDPSFKDPMKKEK